MDKKGAGVIVIEEEDNPDATQKGKDRLNALASVISNTRKIDSINQMA